MRHSQLDTVIPPEIIDDPFATLIEQLAADPHVHNALEIGSSNGAGSTASIVKGMCRNDPKALYCIELSVPRFQELVARYSDRSWVHCHNLPSVPVALMPTDEDVSRFYVQHSDSKIRQFSLKEVLRWLHQDIEYMERINSPEAGIEAAREAAGVDEFDLVLIDGSEFTGFVELEALYGATYVLLDDTMTFKNYESCERLRGDLSYELIAEDRHCRNGFAAFKRR